MAEKKVVIDNGSHFLRAGWSDRDTAEDSSSSSSVFSVRNLVLKPRIKTNGIQPGQQSSVNHNGILIDNGTTTFVGDVPPECLAGFDAFRAPVKSAFERNVVCNFEVAETVFDYVFDKLEGLGSACGGSVDREVVLTECVRNPTYSRQLMAELLFETYGVPGVHMGPDCTFAYAYNNLASASAAAATGERGGNQRQAKLGSSNSSGIVVGMGHSATNLVPIVNGVPHYEHSFRLNVSGLRLTSHLQSLLELKQQQHADEAKKKPTMLGKRDHPLSGFNLAERVKQRMCLVAHDYQDQLRNIQKAVMNGGRGTTSSDNSASVLGPCTCPEISDIMPEHGLSTAVERIQVPEIYFQPSLVGLDQCNVTDAIVSLSKRMAMEVGLGEDAFLQSVLLVGGSSQFRGMSERIERELRSRCKVGTEVNVFNSQDACLDAWKGAAAYANDLLEHNESFAAFVDKSTYNEVGMERTFLYN